MIKLSNIPMTSILLSLLFFGCSPARFSINSECKESNCVSQNGIATYSDSLSVSGGKVDVLIVNDNSASMSFEQKHLAERFEKLITLMESRSIDYRISITTTDISSAVNPPRSINGNGSLQDGNLVIYSNGKKTITPSDGLLSEKINLFSSAIQRPETLLCEKFVLNWIDSGKSRDTTDYSGQYIANCPSSDERGIYAARLSVENLGQEFLRKDADLAIIFLSDEDVRSQYYLNTSSGFGLSEKDSASSLVSYLKTTFPEKKFGMHSIIVTNSTSLAEQSQQLKGAVSGSLGQEYAKASNLSNGVIVDIGTKNSMGNVDYTNAMSLIFSNITTIMVDKIALNCSNPSNLQVVNSAGIPGQIIGSSYSFSQKLPIGTQISYHYDCKATAQ